MKRLYDESGRWVSLDERHAIAKEFCGASKAKWVFRFCGEFISAHDTMRDAKTAALRWEMARATRLAG